MSILVQQLTYIHANKEPLFRELSFAIEKGEKIALLGNNGIGKSTLLRLIQGELQPSSGTVMLTGSSWYVPQHFGQYENCTVAQALGIAGKIEALHGILKGEVTEENLSLLQDDWEVEEQALASLAHWGLGKVGLQIPFRLLSGGERTLVFLAGINLHNPDNILLDEPTNHLDDKNRKKLYKYISSLRSTILVVSHDRMLLEQLPFTMELTQSGVKLYGGNYSFYKEQKELGEKALEEDIRSREKMLKQARRKAQETAEKKQKHEVRGKKHVQKSGGPRILNNALQDKADKSSSRMQGEHEEKIGKIGEELSRLRLEVSDKNRMKVDFGSSALHTGKMMFELSGINFSYPEKEPIWPSPFSLEIRSGERIAFSGANGSGKSTLLKILMGKLTPSAGQIRQAEDIRGIYLDQEYSLIDNALTVYEQLESMNGRNLPEHELKMILHRFLFPLPVWDKKCIHLSGGEKMRLALCCLMVWEQSPDLFILDEPTNNLDIENLEILTSVVKEYKGTLLAVSHDELFLKEIGIERFVGLIK